MISATCAGKIRDVSFTPYDGAEVAARLTFQLSSRRFVGSRWLTTYVSCVIWGRQAQRLREVVTNDAQAVVCGELALAERQRALEMVVSSIEVIRPPQAAQKVTFTINNE